MKVNIENNLYLESDSMQFILKEYNGNEDKHGNPLYKTHGYFPNIKSALKHVMKMKIMNSTASNLIELREDIARIESMINSEFDWDIVAENDLSVQEEAI